MSISPQPQSEWSEKELDSSRVLHEMWATRLRIAMEARRYFQEEEEVLLDEDIEMDEHSGYYGYSEPSGDEIAPSIDPKNVPPEISFKPSDKLFLASIESLMDRTIEVVADRMFQVKKHVLETASGWILHEREGIARQNMQVEREVDALLDRLDDAGLMNQALREELETMKGRMERNEKESRLRVRELEDRIRTLELQDSMKTTSRPSTPQRRPSSTSASTPSSKGPKESPTKTPRQQTATSSDTTTEAATGSVTDTPVVTKNTDADTDTDTSPRPMSPSATSAVEEHREASNVPSVDEFDSKVEVEEKEEVGMEGNDPTEAIPPESSPPPDESAGGGIEEGKEGKEEKEEIGIEIEEETPVESGKKGKKKKEKKQKEKKQKEKKPKEKKQKKKK
eukprot:TRINITY_DN499_c0_g1_i2.p1 TRINITY_DN499_c0_g1~~TRINITY_DN499_c0_g1_i2.p1  ORF type:complete len:395 (-),score=176.58 TRINITY_DN499_c0_g1_i2:276-1460(-)